MNSACDTGFLGGRHNGDALVDHVIAVAYWAQSHGAGSHRFAPVLDRQAGVGDAGGQHHRARDKLAIPILCHEQITVTAQAGHFAFGNVAIVLAQLAAQVVEQLMATNTIGEA